MQNYTLPQVLPFVNSFPAPFRFIQPLQVRFMIEKYLIEHCAPTLASLKTANLFSVSLGAELDADFQLALWNRLLAPKGIELFIIRKEGTSALVYVFRRSMLQRDLEKPGVAEFLRAYGYTSLQPVDALERLVSRLSKSDEFPHEIGLFLGYPLGDVKGFIKHGGRNCKCCGCWKAYCNEEAAQRIFKKYDKCRYVYKKLWQGGRSVLRLTVAA